MGAKELKAILKEWGKPLSGKKADLLDRVLEEVEGGTPHCPITRAARARVQHLRTGRMTHGKAKVSCWATHVRRLGQGKQ
jgi:uracil-DNA glycosylase